MDLDVGTLWTGISSSWGSLDMTRTTDLILLGLASYEEFSDSDVSVSHCLERFRVSRFSRLDVECGDSMLLLVPERPDSPGLFLCRSVTVSGLLADDIVF